MNSTTTTIPDTLVSQQDSVTGTVTSQVFNFLHSLPNPPKVAIPTGLVVRAPMVNDDKTPSPPKTPQTFTSPHDINLISFDDKIVSSPTTITDSPAPVPLPPPLPSPSPPPTSTTAKQWTYDDFMTKLKNPQAAELVNLIKNFVYRLLNAQADSLSSPNNNLTSPTKTKIIDANDEEFTSAVSSFIAQARGHVLNSSFWNPPGTTHGELENIFQGLEKFVMTKIYSKTFASTETHRTTDEKINEKIRHLQTFVTSRTLDLPQHLDDEMLRPAWTMASEELCKINSYKAPSDKVICVMNCSRILIDVIKNHETGKEGSADEFLPALIYVVIKANPAKIYSNVEYITTYRDMRGKEGYFMTQLASAVHFIRDSTHTSFTDVTADVFAGGHEMSTTRNGGELSSTIPSQFSTSLLEPGPARDAWFHARFSFRHVTGIDELRVSDVPSLLENYKMLVDACEALLKEKR